MNRLKFPPQVCWLVILLSTCFVGWADWATGNELNFFVFYFLPVSMAAWYLGLGACMSVAVGCSLVWFAADFLSGRTYSSPAYAVWNTSIRLCSFLAIGWSVQRIHVLLVAERAATALQRRAFAEVKILQGLLRICAECKRIADKQGNWQRLEEYVSDNSQATFTHSYCPECARKLLEDSGLAKKQTAEARPPDDTFTA
jgi:hypothetical protein